MEDSVNIDDFSSGLDARLAKSGTVLDPWANLNLIKFQGDQPPPFPTRVRRKRTFLRPDPVGYSVARAGAGDSECFVALCFAHGSTLFDTARGACLICEAGILQSGLAPAYAAEIIGADHYDDICETHGATLFHTGSEKCAKCSRGQIGRPQTSGARAAARRAGEATYLARCETHGETPHSVQRGLCLTCYNTAGQLRKR